jgi:hypothetical protein
MVKKGKQRETGGGDPKSVKVRCKRVAHPQEFQKNTTKGMGQKERAEKHNQEREQGSGNESSVPLLQLQLLLQT